MTGSKNKKKMASVVIIFLIISCSYLAVSAFLYLSQGEQSVYSNFNVFTDAMYSQKQEAQRREESLYERRSYMLFADEQKKINKQLIGSFQKQISLSPYDKTLWKSLVFFQSAKNTAMDEREWTFLVWAKLHGWNPNERINLINRCVLFVPERKSSELSIVCDEVLKQTLKTRNAGYVARKLKLPLEQFQQVQSYYAEQAGRVQIEVSGKVQ